MKHIVLALIFVCSTLGALSASAQQLHPDNEEVAAGDDPEAFFTSVAIWHLMHNKNRQAIDVLVSQFPSLPKDFGTVTDHETIGEHQLATLLGCCPSSYDMAYDAPPALVLAIIESEGRYALEKGAPRQDGAAQAELVRRAEKLRAAFHGVGAEVKGDVNYMSESYTRMVLGAMTVGLRDGRFDEVLRQFNTEFPDAASLTGSETDSFETSELTSYEVEAFLIATSAVLASEGKIDWAGKELKGKEKQSAQVKKAIALYRASGIENVAIEASILEADPARRNEYFRFVHEAALEGKFENALGWRHADAMYRELGKQAANAVDRFNHYATPPQPYYQSCGE